MEPLDAANTRSFFGPALSTPDYQVTIRQLENGVPYKFTVRAIAAKYPNNANAAASVVATPAPSSVPCTPLAYPSPVRNLRATPQPAAALICFDAPFGGCVDEYRITVTPLNQNNRRASGHLCWHCCCCCCCCWARAPTLLACVVRAPSPPHPRPQPPQHKRAQVVWRHDPAGQPGWLLHRVAAHPWCALPRGCAVLLCTLPVGPHCAHRSHPLLMSVHARHEPALLQQQAAARKAPPPPRHPSPTNQPPTNPPN